MSRHDRSPNQRLHALIAQSGASHKALAQRINELGAIEGHRTAYTHTSVANWVHGMVPRWPTPRLLAQSIAERLGRPVTVTEIGMVDTETTRGTIGLDYPRDLPAAIRHATTFWSTVNRRDFVSSSAFAVATYAMPVRRWLVIDFFNHPRLAADAIEIHRDLHLPDHALRWNTQAAMPTDVYTRSHGIRLTVLAGIHLQNRTPDLDQALHHGNHAITVLSHVASARAIGYTHDLLRRLRPWQNEPAVGHLTRRFGVELAAPPIPERSG